MNSFAGFAHRMRILARFKRTMLIFWLPLVLAAAVLTFLVALNSQ